MDKMKLLIVDDEKDLCRILSDRLHILYGVSPDVAHSGAEAMEMIKKTPYDVVILDIDMPGMDGMETLKQIKAVNAKIQVVMFTGHGTDETRRMAEVLGAFSYVDKIDGLPKLAPMVEGAYRLRKMLEDTYADAALNEYS
ncbi:response regulator [Desulfovibrio aminophilus]|nr:response regulator [Desulfovibrio aminophilus]MCM0755779.1 response regulator [Desulfovibrio aminophilus]